MPNPISATNSPRTQLNVDHLPSNQSGKSTSESTPSTSQTANASSAGSPPATALTNLTSADATGANQLVNAHSSKAESPSLRLVNALGSEGSNSSASRTAGNDATLFHAGAGVTSARDAVYVEAGLLKGTDRGANAELEVAAVSLQAGAQNEESVVMARLGMVSDSGDKLTIETATARRGFGMHNTDGSTGANLGGAINAVALEGTVKDDSGNSASFGLSIGLAAEGSLGVRDADGDGKTEYCARVAVGPVSVGVCAEKEKVQELGETVVETASAAAHAVAGFWERF